MTVRRSLLRRVARTLDNVRHAAQQVIVRWQYEDAGIFTELDAAGNRRAVDANGNPFDLTRGQSLNWERIHADLDAMTPEKLEELARELEALPDATMGAAVMRVRGWSRDELAEAQAKLVRLVGENESEEDEPEIEPEDEPEKPSLIERATAWITPEPIEAEPPKVLNAREPVEMAEPEHFEGWSADGDWDVEGVTHRLGGTDFSPRGQTREELAEEDARATVRSEWGQALLKNFGRKSPPSTGGDSPAERN